MPNKHSENEFYIDSFEPRHLKKSSQYIDKHLHAAQKHANTNDDYKYTVFKEVKIWDKIKRILHLT